MQPVSLYDAPASRLIEGQLFEYQLLIRPDAVVNEKINAARESLAATYQVNTGTGASVLKLAGFFAREEMEGTIIRYLHRSLREQQGFTVTLTNYSGFPPHTVYLRVQEPGAIHALGRHIAVINEYLHANGCPPVQQSHHPHLSLARQLPERVYDKAMLDFSQRLFHEHFTAREIILLKKNYAADPGRELNLFQLLPAVTVI